MKDLVILLKSYIGDIDRAKRLIDSYKKYNADRIPMYILCPQSDKESFEAFADEDINIIAEESIQEEIFSRDTRWTAGYLNQEIYKLSFWKLGICENYLCVDSDALFIRPFYKRDFMYDEHTPYTCLMEDKELQADLYYSREYWSGRMESIEKIEDRLDFHPNKLMTCHGMQVFSSAVLKDMEERYLEPNGYRYKDLIEIAPYEFSWYNLWLQKTGAIPLHICEPFFKTIHLKQHHINEVLRGMTIEDWARGYLGIIVNSNFGAGDGNYEDISVYTAENCGIPDSLIFRNYKFYKRLRNGLFKRKVRFVINSVMRKVKGNRNG